MFLFSFCARKQEGNQVKVMIRQATLSDLEASYRVECACFPEDEAASKETIDIRLRRFPQGFIVAELDNTIVGLINSGATSKDDISNEALKSLIGHQDKGKNLVIFSVAVQPDYQKRGIAGQLLREYIRRARTMPHDAILLLCKENLTDYYAKFGFENRGLSESTHGGATWYQMGLTLKK